MAPAQLCRLAIAVLAVSAAAAGCAISAAPTAASAGEAPPDLTLDVLVAGPPDGPWVGHRYVLFPDGALHHDVTDDAGADRLPVLRRVLDRAQTREVWRLASAAAAAGDVPDAPSGDALVMGLTIGAGGHWARHRVPVGGGSSPAAAALLERLAILAWAGETSAEAIIAPKRYDLGPDPYERYRP